MVTTIVTTLDMVLSAIRADRETFESMTKDRRGGGRRLVQMRARMLMVQGGICTKCGDEIDGLGEWAHLVPQSFFGAHGATGGRRVGYVDGNMSVWCPACNAAHGETDTTAASLARPDLVWLGTWKDLPMLPR